MSDKTDTAAPRKPLDELDRATLRDEALHRYLDLAKEEIDRLERLVTAERDRFREHGVMLNSIPWRAAEVLGEVPEGAEQIPHDSDRVDRLIADRERLSRELAETRAERDHVAARYEQLRSKLIPKGFGRRNVHCSNCGDERGGPFGHETSECRYRSGMAAFEVAEIQPEHRRAKFWEVAVDRYLAMELGEFTVTLTRQAAPTPANTADEPRPMWDQAALDLIRQARVSLLRAREVVAARHESPWMLGVTRWLANAAAFLDDAQVPAVPGADEQPTPTTITESEAERLANLRDCIGTSRGGLHCEHYQEGEGNCHDCGRANYCPDGGVVPDPSPQLDETWRDFTIHTDWGSEQDVYVACRLDDVCEEVVHNPDGALLTLGEAVDWAKGHAASPFHAAPDAVLVAGTTDEPNTKMETPQ